MFSIFILVLFINLVNDSLILTKNPKKYTFTNNDISKFEKAFLFKFPENTKFIEAQYKYNFQNPTLILNFEIPVDTVNSFLAEIGPNYKESYLSDRTEKAESNFESNQRQFTHIYFYSDENKYKKIKLIYDRPSDDLGDIFQK